MLLFAIFPLKIPLATAFFGGKRGGGGGPPPTKMKYKKGFVLSKKMRKKGGRGGSPPPQKRNIKNALYCQKRCEKKGGRGGSPPTKNKYKKGFDSQKTKKRCGGGGGDGAMVVCPESDSGLRGVIPPPPIYPVCVVLPSILSVRPSVRPQMETPHISVS